MKTSIEQKPDEEKSLQVSWEKNNCFHMMPKTRLAGHQSDFCGEAVPEARCYHMGGLITGR